jgi:hypothetical protein
MVMVGYNGQVAVAFAVGDLIDPDPIQVLQAAGVDVLGDDPAHDPSDGLPACA